MWTFNIVWTFKCTYIYIYIYICIIYISMQYLFVSNNNSSYIHAAMCCYIVYTVYIYIHWETHSSFLTIFWAIQRCLRITSYEWYMMYGSYRICPRFDALGVYIPGHIQISSYCSCFHVPSSASWIKQISISCCLNMGRSQNWSN